jgi:hypothetical protein
MQLQDKLQGTKSGNDVSLGVLINFAQVMQDRFEDILKRILAGFGLDTSNNSSKIDFEIFCKIKCFLKFYTLDEKELNKIWIKIINP